MHVSFYFLRHSITCCYSKRHFYISWGKLPQPYRGIPEKDDITHNFPSFIYISAMQSSCGKCSPGKFHSKVTQLIIILCPTPVAPWKIRLKVNLHRLIADLCVPQRWPTPCRSCSACCMGCALTRVWKVCPPASPAETPSSIWWPADGRLTPMSGLPSSVSPEKSRSAGARFQQKISNSACSVFRRRSDRFNHLHILRHPIL